MRRVRGNSGLNEFVEFRKLITPVIIKSGYMIGALGITGASLLGIVAAEKGTSQMLYGVLLLFFGNILWRVICEGVILLFSLHDVAVSIAKMLESGRQMEQEDRY